MCCGFQSLKDVLDILVIPIILALLAVWLPAGLQNQGEKQRRNTFVRLIRREPREMRPDPLDTTPNGKWWQHLKKRFIHEHIFRSPSLNRDFILSLNPDLAYWEAQMWIHFDKAPKSTTEDDLKRNAKLWCEYLSNIGSLLDMTKEGQRETPRLYDDIYKPWEELVDRYHPGLVKGDCGQTTRRTYGGQTA